MRAAAGDPAECFEETATPAPLETRAWFTRAPGSGVGAGVGGGFASPSAPHASTSTRRLYTTSEVLTCTRIFVVCRGAKVIRFHTLLFPATLPPGTVAHAVPVQYCTSNPVAPYDAKVIAVVGSAGAA